MPNADYQSICVTWLLHFPFHLFALLQPFTVLKLKIEAIFLGKIAIFWGIEWPLLLSSEESFERNGISTYDYLHLVYIFFSKAFSFVTENLSGHLVLLKSYTCHHCAVLNLAPRTEARFACLPTSFSTVDRGLSQSAFLCLKAFLLLLLNNCNLWGCKY